MHYQCLIVDDEIELAMATCEYFNLFNLSATYVSSAKECEEFLRKNDVDLLLLDINLQDESGFILCKNIRKKSNIPILFISARQSDDDILVALNIGGDDYIKKPYTLSILVAKVKAMLKRVGIGKQIDDNLQISEQEIEIKEDTMSVIISGKEVFLKAKEFKLFSYLYKNANKIVTKDTLFTAVWGNSFYSDGTLNVHIRRLREKLEENPNEPTLIKTIWGTGYKFEI